MAPALPSFRWIPGHKNEIESTRRALSGQEKTILCTGGATFCLAIPGHKKKNAPAVRSAVRSPDSKSKSSARDCAWRIWVINP